MRRAAVHRPSIGNFLLDPTGIIASRVSITAAAIIGLVPLLFICGREKLLRIARAVRNKGEKKTGRLREGGKSVYKGG